MERGNRRLQYLITSAVSTTSICNGVVFSWTTPIIPKIHNNEIGFHLTETELSWMVAVLSLGFMTGSLVSRFFADRYGRRANLLGSVTPLGVGLETKKYELVATTIFEDSPRFLWDASSDPGFLIMVFLIIAKDVWTICTGRFLLGLAAGMISSVATIYLAEIADKEIRGRLILSIYFMFSFGCLLMFTIGPFVDYLTINYAMVFLPILYFSTCWFIPESPYFLVKKGRVDDAEKTLAMLTNLKDEKLEERLTQLRSDVRKEMTRSGTAKEFFTGKQYRKALIIIAGVKLTHLMSGLHPIQQYLGVIIQESKIDMKLSTSLIIFGVVRFVVGVVSSLLVDKVGRRPLLIYSFFGVSAIFGIVGVFFYLPQQTTNPFRYVPYVGIILAIVIAVLGFESITYAMPSELFPINIKAVATTSVYIFNGLVNFLSVTSYQQLKNLGGLSTVFCVYAIASLFGAIFSIFFVLETKRKSLRQIQIELQGNVYDDDSAEKLQSALNMTDKRGFKEESKLKIIKKMDKV